MRKVLILAFLTLCVPAAAQQAVEDIVMSNAEHTLWHEAGHALISEFELPVIGQEEDAVDAFATLMMMGEDDADRIERLLDVAELWIVSQERDQADGVDLDYFAEHDLDVQRGLRVICFIAGEGPGRAHEMIGEWGLPEDRAETCEDDYVQALDSWDALLEPYLTTGDGPTVPVAVRYGAGNWRERLAGSELLEYVAEALGADYALDPGLTLAAESCGEPNAFWDPDAREVTLCYELLDDYELMAQTLVNE